MRATALERNDQIPIIANGRAMRNVRALHNGEKPVPMYPKKDTNAAISSAGTQNKT
jgi:hypothetical protein